MSSDNGYIIRKHPSGGYAAVHYFASDDKERLATRDHTQYPTVAAAVSAKWDDWTEYGVNVHPEVYEK